MPNFVGKLSRAGYVEPTDDLEFGDPTSNRRTFMKFRHLMLAAFGFATAISHANAQLWMYAIDGRGELFRNELGSTEVAPVADFGLNATSGLARGPGATIYTIDSLTGIYQINPATGNTINEFTFDTLDPDDPFAGNTGGLTYDAQSNKLHALRVSREDAGRYLFTADMNSQTSNLVKLGTGNEPWLSSPYGLNSIMTRSDGLLVGIATNIFDGANHIMFEIDPGSGAVEFIANLPSERDRWLPTGISSLGSQSYMSSLALNPNGTLIGTDIHELNLYTGATNYVSTVLDQTFFGLVVNPAPSSIAGFAALGLIASRRRRIASAG